MVIRLPMAYCFDQKRVKKRIRQWTESEKFGGRVEVSYLPMLDVVVSVIWPIVVYRKRTVLTTKRGGEQKKTQSKESRSNSTQFRRNGFSISGWTIRKKMIYIYILLRKKPK